MVFIAYTSLGHFGLIFQLPKTNASVVWPPSGFALAAAIIYGYQLWPGIFLGAFLNAFLHLPYDINGLLASFSIGIGNMAEILVVALSLKYFVKEENPFLQTRHLFVFVISSIFGAAIAATIGSGIQVFMGYIPYEISISAWSTWWLGDLSSILIFVPAVLFLRKQNLVSFGESRKTEMALVILGTVLISKFIFTALVSHGSVASLPYLIIVGVLCSSIRFGPQISSFMVALLSLISIVEMWFHFTPFQMSAGINSFLLNLKHNVSPHESLMIMQAFVCSLAITGLTVSTSQYERIVATLDLKKTVLKYRELFSRFPEGLLLVDLESGLIEACNESFAFFCGETKEDLLGTNLKTRLFFDDSGNWQFLCTHLLQGLDDYEFQCKVQNKFGSHIDLNITATFFGCESISKKQVRLVCRDITLSKKAAESLVANELILKKNNEWLEENVLKRTQELEFLNEKLLQEIKIRERSNQELEQFAYIVSHDLHEPLRAISGYMTLLSDRNKNIFDAESLEFTKFAVDGALRMQIFIKDLLSYSRIRGDQKEFQTVAIQKFLTEIIDDFRFQFQFESAKINLVNTEVTVIGLPELLRQLFSNLISNALKFRNESQVKIEISALRKENQIEFCVADNGIGIEPTDFDRIFLIFERLHMRHIYAGNGMGLAICKRVVEFHGCKIWVKSELTVGSCFYFTLPAES